MQDCGRRIRMDARHWHRRGGTAGRDRHSDGAGHAEIQVHAASDGQHQPGGARKPDRPARGARLQRRRLSGIEIHAGQQGTDRNPAVHQPCHGGHDAADEHHHERPDARRLLDRRIPDRSGRRHRQTHHLREHGGVLQLFRAGDHELPADEHGIRAVAARRRIRTARA